MSDRDELRIALCKTYLLFRDAAEKCPVGPIANAAADLADALRSFGYLPSEAEEVVASYQEQQA